MQYHIVLGSEANLADLRQDGELDGFTIWTINKKARTGDYAFFYFTSPVSAVVAMGVCQSNAALVTDQDDDWFGFHMIQIGEIEFLNNPVKRADLIDLPGWRYFYSPIQSAVVRESAAPQFRRIIEQHRL
jgi:hypothetical protein